MSKFSYVAACFLLGGVVTAAIWLPFGFEMGGLIEEWGLLGLYSKHGHFYLSGREGLLPSLAMRPLTFLIPGLANQLSSHSFVPWHVLLILALLLKGAMGGWLVWRLSQSRMLGAVAVLLFILYPADTMHVSLRSLHIVWAITLVMLGACALIVALERDGRMLVPGALAVLAAILTVGGIAMYEAALALLFLIPGYFFVQLGAGGVLTIARRKFWVWLIFAIGIGLYGVYLVSVSSGSSYQGNLVGGGSVLGLLAVTWPKLFTVGALHAVWGGWVEAFRLATDQPMSNQIYLAVCTIVLLAAAVGMCLPASRPVEGLQSVQAFRLMLIGGAMALAGYLPYLLSLHHLSINQRTFLAASPGAALLWVGVLALVVARSRKVMLLMSFPAVFLGLTFQLHQFSHYQDLSDLQRRMLGEVVSQYGQREGAPPIVVRDHGNSLGHTWMFLPENLGYALSYVIGHPTGPLEICRLPAGEWMRRDGLGRTGHCHVADGQWVFEAAPLAGGPGVPVSSEPRRVVRWPLSTTVTLDVGQDMVPDSRGSLSLPSTSGSKQDPANPTGLYEVRWPLKGLLWQSAHRVRDCYRWDFGDVWSLDLPIRGSGWREAEWEVSRLRKTSAAWKTDERGSLYFELLPKDDSYLLQFQLAAIARESVLKSLVLSVNGVPLPMTQQGLEGRAIVPAGLLKQGSNVMVFESDVARDYYGVSIKLDRVVVAPMARDAAEGVGGC